MTLHIAYSAYPLTTKIDLYKGDIMQLPVAYKNYNLVHSYTDAENMINHVLLISLPTLLYATEVCLLNKSDIRALDYVVHSALKKIFDTNSKRLYSNVS